VEGSCGHGDEPSGSLILLRIFGMAAQLAASQEGLSSVRKSILLGRSVGIVCLRTKATEFSLVSILLQLRFHLQPAAIFSWDFQLLSHYDHCNNLQYASPEVLLLNL
jgi:hypothetical protein